MDVRENEIRKVVTTLEKYGPPTLFLRMFLNEKWIEFNQIGYNPVTKVVVFYAKFMCFYNDLLKEKLGKYNYVIGLVDSNKDNNLFADFMI